MVLHPLPHSHSPPWGYQSLMGNLPAPLYMYIWIEIHMQIIWGTIVLRNGILLFCHSQVYFLHRYKNIHIYQVTPWRAGNSSFALETCCYYGHQQVCLRWVSKDPLHQALPQGTSIPVGLSTQLAGFQLFSLKNKFYNNWNFPSTKYP